MYDTVEPGRAGWNDDVYVKQYREFIAQYMQASKPEEKDKLAYAQPALFWAHQLQSDPSAVIMAMHVKARVLAGQTDSQISDEIGSLPEMVFWYTQLWFDVRDRLTARDWIVNNVLAPEMLRQHGSAEKRSKAGKSKEKATEPPLMEPFADASLLFFGYYGGPKLLDSMLTGFASDDQLDDSAGRDDWLDRNFNTGIRRKSVAGLGAFSLNKYNVTEIFELHQSLVALQKSNASMSARKDKFEKIIESATREIKLVVGPKGPNEKALLKYDMAAAELRDDEIFDVVSGRKSYDDVAKLVLPAQVTPAKQVTNDQVIEHK